MKSKGYSPTTVNLPLPLKKLLTAQAKAARRSLSSHVVHVLETVNNPGDEKRP